MKVRDVMTKDPVTAEPEAPLRMAKALMQTKAIRHLPVVDEGGRLLGILTDRDIEHAAFIPALAEHFGTAPQMLKAPRVRDVMTWSVVTIQPEATLAQAGLTMFQRRIGSLPVVEDGKLVGILTGRDVLAALRNEQETEGAPESNW